MNKNDFKKNKLAMIAYQTYKRALGKRLYLKQYADFKNKLSVERGFTMESKDKNMILGENTEVTRFDAHYVYHSAWAARILQKTQPKFHVDISSTLVFSAIVSAFLPVEFYDYRPANIHLKNLISKKANLQNLPFENESLISLSCMHTVEHIGLGRYGDPIDPDGDLEAISELKRVLVKDGNLLFVVPVGKPRIVFNAHRIYSYDQIMNYFSDLVLQEFSLIPDNAIETGILTNSTKEISDKQNYGCGLFWFTKSPFKI